MSIFPPPDRFTKTFVAGPLKLTARHDSEGLQLLAATGNVLAILSAWASPLPLSTLEISYRSGALRIDFRRLSLRVVRRPEKSY